MTLSIEVYFDFICPWCLIGKRQLDQALAQLRVAQPEVQVAVSWRGVQLLPGSVCLSWLICVRVREESGGRRYTLWFWPGCSSPESLRALRRRLTLEG